MKVLLIAPSFPPRTGGLETYVAHLAEALAVQGHSIVVLTNSDLEEQPAIEERFGYTVWRTRALLAGHGHENYVPWERSYFALLNDIADFASDAQFDVVHCHTQVSLLIAHLSGLSQRSPIVASFHETNPFRDKLGEQRTQFIVRRCPAARYAVGSEAFAAQARSFGIEDELIRVVRMGIRDRHHTDREVARRELSMRYGVSTERILITLLGRFTPRKQHEQALFALERMSQRHNVQLLFAGSDNSTDPVFVRRLRRVVAAAAPSVIWLENIPDADRDLLVDATDLGLQPSSKEGLGLAAVEFMMAGVPILVADIEGLREVVGEHTTCLVDANSVEHLARRIDELVESTQERATLGMKLQQRARMELSIEQAAVRTLSVYAEALSCR